MIDDTGPVCVDYRIRDGTHRLLDGDFQADNTRVTGQWRSGSFDLESLVARFEVRLEDLETGVVLAGPLNVGKATTVTFKELKLNHTQRVRTVVASINRAGAVSECVTDGTLIDLTGPVPDGSDPLDVVRDGNSALHGWEGEDLEYTHTTQAAFASWLRFRDPESGMNNFWVWAEDVDGEPLSERRWVHPSLSEWTLPIPQQVHGSQYRVVMRAVNRASSQREYRSNGIGVDVTPPEFTSPVSFSVPPSARGLEPHIINSEGAKLTISVQARDDDSGLRRCRYALGTYPDGSDLTGVVTVDADAFDAAGVQQETRYRGGQEVCDVTGVCVDVPVSSHEVVTTATVSEIMNGDVDLLNHFTMYAWVVCINKYVTAAPAACALCQTMC